MNTIIAYQPDNFKDIFLEVSQIGLAGFRSYRRSIYPRAPIRSRKDIVAKWTIRLKN